MFRAGARMRSCSTSFLQQRKKPTAFKLQTRRVADSASSFTGYVFTPPRSGDENAYSGKSFYFAKETLESRSASATLELNDKLFPVTVPVPANYIRDLCQCPHCVDASSGQKKFDTAQIPFNVQFKSLVQKGNVVKVQWSNDVPGFPENHETILRTDQIWAPVRNPKFEDLPSRRLVRTWRRRDFTNRWQSHKFDFQDLVSDRDARTFNQVLESLCASGLVLIQNVPESEDSVAKIAERFGPLYNSIYGLTWDVKDKPRAENVAYTSGFLGLHTDLMYMKDPPRLQLLHCIKSTCEGGESIFVDGFRAATDFLLTSEEEKYEALATYPVRYRYKREEYELFDSKPTIELSSTELGRFNRRQGYTKYPLISHINYSPPFQDQLTFDISDGRRRGSFLRYHSALGNFAKNLTKPSNLFRHRLEPGECVIFDNRRVLHGREKFDSGTGERWLKGAYVAGDDFEAHVRKLSYSNLQGRQISSEDHETTTEHQSQSDMEGGVQLGVSHQDPQESFTAV